MQEGEKLSTEVRMGLTEELQWHVDKRGGSQSKGQRSGWRRGRVALSHRASEHMQGLVFTLSEM
jgi:hypothetical protein